MIYYGAVDEQRRRPTAIRVRKPNIDSYGLTSKFIDSSYAGVR